MLYHTGPYSSLPRGDSVGAEATTATAAAVLWQWARPTKEIAAGG